MSKHVLTALLLLLPLPVAATSSGDPGELKLNASNGDLGLGGIKQWDFQVSMDAMLDPADAHQAEQPHKTTEAHLNVNRFLFSGQTEHLSIQLGHHRIARQSLLFDDNTDWGLSASSDFAPLNSNLSVFAVSAGGAPTTVRGMRLSDSTPWYTGGVLQSALPLSGSNTTLWASYVNGRDSGQGPGTLDGLQASLQYRLGYSVGVNSSWLDDRLSIELEQASSRFSMDGDNTPQHISDSAYLASLQYQPELNLPFMNCVLGTEARNIGNAFFSPGNQSMARARSYERVYLNLEPFDIGSLGYSYREMDVGYGPRQLSSYGNEVFADLNLAPWDWLSLQPYGEFEQRRYQSLDTTGHHSLLSLTANAWLIPERLVYRNTIKLTRSHGPDNSFLTRDRRRQHIAGELQWQALSPTRNRTGLDVNLSFSADRHESRVNPDGSLDDYQVLLSISSNGDGASRIW